MLYVEQDMTRYTRSHVESDARISGQDKIIVAFRHCGRAALCGRAHVCGAGRSVDISRMKEQLSARPGAPYQLEAVLPVSKRNGKAA